jgi:hypothetical protein
MRSKIVRNRAASWLKIVSRAIKLGATAQTVIALRTVKLAKGGAAAKRESKRMVDEKIKAAFDAYADAAQSGLSGKALQIPKRTLALYEKRARNNLRRLLKR